MYGKIVVKMGKNWSFISMWALKCQMKMF